MCSSSERHVKLSKRICVGDFLATSSSQPRHNGTTLTVKHQAFYAIAQSHHITFPTAINVPKTTWISTNSAAVVGSHFSPCSWTWQWGFCSMVGERDQISDPGLCSSGSSEQANHRPTDPSHEGSTVAFPMDSLNSPDFPFFFDTFNCVCQVAHASPPKPHGVTASNGVPQHFSRGHPPTKEEGEEEDEGVAGPDGTDA